MSKQAVHCWQLFTLVYDIVQNLIKHETSPDHSKQQTIKPMLVQCWSAVYDVGPTLNLVQCLVLAGIEPLWLNVKPPSQTAVWHYTTLNSTYRARRDMCFIGHPETINPGGRGAEGQRWPPDIGWTLSSSPFSLPILTAPVPGSRESECRAGMIMVAFWALCCPPYFSIPSLPGSLPRGHEALKRCWFKFMPVS